jgi:hypothetical protein
MPRDDMADMVDIDGLAHRRLGVGDDDVAQFLVRPDGHIGYRAAGGDLSGLRTYLDRWLTGCEPTGTWSAQRAQPSRHGRPTCLIPPALPRSR